MFESKCVAVYVNRLCPRKCPYCGAIKPELDKRKLSPEQWKDIFEYLSKELKMEFFLILGLEPLLLRENLLKLVEYWRDYEYGLYSTSPQPLFDEYKYKLLDAGLRNWSSGCDFIEEVYEDLKKQGKLTEKCIKLVESQRKGLVKKAIDALNGLKFMSDHGVAETLVLITVSRMNIEFVPEMIVWLCEYFPERTVISLNFAEWKDEEDMDFDFVTPKSYCPEFFFADDDFGVWVRFLNKLKDIPLEYLARVQVPRTYFANWDWIKNLDNAPDHRYCSIAIDCDGSFRLCGYRTGSEVSRCNALDLMSERVSKEEIYEAWRKDLNGCKGCYWAWPYMIKEFGPDIVNFFSPQWLERKRRWIEYWKAIKS